MPRSFDLGEALARYNPRADPKVPRAEEEREKIRRLFPLERWPAMRLEHYALGQERVADTFCRLIEVGSMNIGHWRGGTAKKFIIYKHRDKPSGHDLVGVGREPGGNVGEAARGVVEVDLQGATGRRRNSLDSAHRGSPQSPTVEPPTQERGGDRVHETLLFGFSHLAVPSGFSRPRCGGQVCLQKHDVFDGLELTATILILTSGVLGPPFLSLPFPRGRGGMDQPTHRPATTNPVGTTCLI